MVVRRADLDGRERDGDAEDRARRAGREEVHDGREARAGADPDADARMGHQKAAPITRQRDVLERRARASLVAAALQSAGACQIHIAPTPAAHEAARRPARDRSRPVGRARPSTSTGARQSDERRHDQHKEHVLEHVRAEEVAARERRDGRREREDHGHRGSPDERDRAARAGRGGSARGARRAPGPAGATIQRPPGPRRERSSSPRGHRAPRR